MNSRALDQFLAGIERRAFRIAMLGVRNDQAALDIVQESMMRLAEKYSHQDPAEWPLLFQRILQNAILDHHRRQKVRRAAITLFGDLLPAGSEDGENPYEGGVFDVADAEEAQPQAILAQKELRKALEQAISALPIRQQQAFVLRYWEGMDIAQTAQIMGCSEGSVKTHCSRATKALSDQLAFLKQDFHR